MFSSETVDLVGIVNVGGVGAASFACVKLVLQDAHEQIKFVQDHICQDGRNNGPLRHTAVGRVIR
jgi:bisphosphoglycerate-independent phosphoglycerate mutase (AlkP superfamily)